MEAAEAHRAEGSLTEHDLLSGRTSGERLQLTASGEWTADNAAVLDRLVTATAPAEGAVSKVDIDMRRVEKLDTYGAWLVERLIQGATEKGAQARLIGLPERFGVIVRTVHQNADELPPAPERTNLFIFALATIGRNMVEVGKSIALIAQMFGAVTMAFVRAVMHPTTFRWTSLVNQIDLVGWRAVPIILLITFLIGAILAQQGIFHFRRFGADIFVVDMVGILVLREVGVLIVCVMVAGRSGSAYTAELGSMKMREEIDALQIMGLDPVSILVLPRIIALIVAVPMLTFLGSMAAMYGGGLVAYLYGGISPEVFLQRLREAISVDHFIVGMVKAPFMALIIGIVACVEGLQVEGSAESLGMKTTSAVVKSIFLVMVLDGVFAMFFAAINL
ncbi:MAG: MlaE family lipid ABC transporter permease subunit [Pseudorhodoplanes sp.]|nr:MlaE family lipid ABC transporter permease subunit [Pseudorhodoplanes sp.]